MSQTALKRPSPFKHSKLALSLLAVLAAVSILALVLGQARGTDSTDESGRNASQIAPGAQGNSEALPGGVAERNTFVALDWNSDQPRLHVVAADGRELASRGTAKYAQAAVNLSRGEVVTMERLFSGWTEVKTVDLGTGAVAVLSSALPEIARSPIHMPRAIISANGETLYYLGHRSKLGVEARCDETRDSRDCDEFSVVSFDLSARLPQQANLPGGCASGILFPFNQSDAGVACINGALYSISSAAGLTFTSVGTIPERADPTMREQTWVLGAWQVDGKVWALNSDGSVASVDHAGSSSIDHRIPDASWRPMNKVGWARQFGKKLYVPVVRDYFEQHPARLAVVDLGLGTTNFVLLPSDKVDSIQPISETSMALVVSGRLYRWDIGSSTMTPVSDQAVGIQASLVD